MPVSELASERLRDRQRLAAAVKEAGAIALSFFRGPLRSWTKGQGDSPVSEADIAANDLLQR
ncbi:MAG: 3'(2'),5'-bisphosphate nucleotidase CysQ, partial [Xanthobacteraceae bacterium]